jgi:predicted HD superfamily hydrolase involved in NAD metabolism
MNNEELIYQKNYVPFTREELIDVIAKSIDGSRFEHVLRVEKKAIELAQKYDADIEKASITGLLHDYAKQRSDSEFIKYINELELDPQLLDYGNAIWHGVVGAEIVKNELKIYDEEILNAIRRHTVGAPYMTLIDQIVFMADYIEDGRDFEGVEQARLITEQNLQKGVTFQMKSTLAYLIAGNKPVFPTTIESYNAWISKFN